MSEECECHRDKRYGHYCFHNSYYCVDMAYDIPEFLRRKVLAGIQWLEHPNL